MGYGGHILDLNPRVPTGYNLVLQPFWDLYCTSTLKEGPELKILSAYKCSEEQIQWAGETNTKPVNLSFLVWAQKSRITGTTYSETSVTFGKKHRSSELFSFQCLTVSDLSTVWESSTPQTKTLIARNKQFPSPGTYVTFSGTWRVEHPAKLMFPCNFMFYFEHIPFCHCFVTGKNLNVFHY